MDISLSVNRASLQDLVYAIGTTRQASVCFRGGSHQKLNRQLYRPAFAPSSPEWGVEHGKGGEVQTQDCNTLGVFVFAFGACGMKASYMEKAA
jgi:hypothetical protein